MYSGPKLCGFGRRGSSAGPRRVSAEPQRCHAGRLVRGVVLVAEGGANDPAVRHWRLVLCVATH